MIHDAKTDPSAPDNYLPVRVEANDVVFYQKDIPEATSEIEEDIQMRTRRLNELATIRALSDFHEEYSIFVENRYPGNALVAIPKIISIKINGEWLDVEDVNLADFPNIQSYRVEDSGPTIKEHLDDSENGSIGARQIAALSAFVEFYASKGFLFMDLATHNICMDSKGIIRITDLDATLHITQSGGFEMVLRKVMDCEPLVMVTPITTSPEGLLYNLLANGRISYTKPQEAVKKLIEVINHFGDVRVFADVFIPFKQKREALYQIASDLLRSSESIYWSRHDLFCLGLITREVELQNNGRKGLFRRKATSRNGNLMKNLSSLALRPHPKDRIGFRDFTNGMLTLAYHQELES